MNTPTLIDDKKPLETPLIQRRFNHDLLLDAADQATIAAQWPAIAWLFVHPELIQAFKPSDAMATRYKRIAQWLGTLAVLLMMASLLGSAWELWSGAHGKEAAARGERSCLVILIEAAAVGGLVCAVLASRRGPFRRRWLKHRFVTEVLRQWHFRRLLDGEAIDLAMSNSEGFTHYANSRQIAFASFLHGLRGSVGQKMDQLTEGGADPLVHFPAPRLAAESGTRKDFLEAYCQLRLDHQLDYTVYKLSEDDRTFLGLSGKALVWLTDQLSGATLMLALALSICRLFWPLPWVPFAAVWLVIGGVAVRTWRDGLLLGEERERYQEMRHRLELVKARWESAADDDRRFSLAAELEQAALEELRAFVREHEAAQFLIQLFARFRPPPSRMRPHGLLLARRRPPFSRVPGESLTRR